MKKIAPMMFVGMLFVSAQAMDQAQQVAPEQVMVNLTDTSLASAEIVQNTLAQVIELDQNIAKMLCEACQKKTTVANETVFVLRDDSEGDDAWVEPVDVRALLRTHLILGAPFVDVDGVVHPLVRSIVCSFLQIQEKGDGSIELVNTFRLPERMAALTLTAKEDGDAAGAAAAAEETAVEEESVGGAAAAGVFRHPSPGSMRSGAGLAAAGNFSIGGAVLVPARTIGGQRHGQAKHKKHGKWRK